MILLIKQSDITNSTPLGGNIDEAKYIPAVKSAQLTSIKPMLGAALYNKIVSDFGDGTLADDYLRLYEDYIKPMLIHLGASYYLTTGAYQIDNRGITRHSSDNAVGVSKEDIDYIVKQQEKLYEFYKREFYSNIGNYDVPEYSQNLASKNTKRIGGWALGGGKGNCSSGTSNSYSNNNYNPSPPKTSFETDVDLVNDYPTIGANIGDTQETFNLGVEGIIGLLSPQPNYNNPLITLGFSNISKRYFELGESISTVLQSRFTFNDAGKLTKTEFFKDGSVIGTNTSTNSADLPYTGVIPLGDTIFRSKGTYEDGIVKINSITGQPDPRGMILAGSITSSNKVITGLLPWFYKIFDNPPDLDNLDLSTFTKVVGVSTGDITISSINMVQKYMVIATPSTSATKTKWYCTPSNTGDIGAGNVFAAPLVKSLSSPNGYWSNTNYKVYATVYETDFNPILRLTN